MLLEPEQEELLRDLVEAERNLPRDQRVHFHLSRTIGGPGVDLIHPGLPDGFPRVFEGDIETLAGQGLLSMSYHCHGSSFYVTPYGFAYYAEIQERSEEPVDRMEELVRRYLDAPRFRQRYPEAFEKWSQAEQLLWRSDSQAQLTTIGHLAREAVQEFSTRLLDHFGTEEAPADKAATVARLKAVVQYRKNDLGSTKAPLLEALVAYWGTVSDLVQRQEHGATKEGERLRWQDGRMVVFQSAIVMFEIDATLSHTGPV